MSKTITIPAALGNRITVIINGVTHVLATGSAISVPDEVAALFDNNALEAPKTGGAGSPLLAAGLYEGDDAIPVYVTADGHLVVKKDDVAAAAPAELPEVSAEDDGSVLTVVDGAWAAVAPDDGGGE